MLRGLSPKYRRYNIYDLSGKPLPNTADWTITAQPLPRPPPAELANETNNATIANNPHLFHVSTPINIDRFQELLATHPNQPFVQSVITGLREGFWPCADTTREDYPVTHDAHIGTTTDNDEKQFLEKQIEMERGKGRFSEPFGPDLLPGMYSMPIHAVPKDNGRTFRMVVNHSATKKSLNSMIDKDTLPPSPLDNMRHVGDRLLRARLDDPTSRLTMWKADVAEAYRLLPVHPHWQLKQIITFGNKRYVDWRNNFGNRAAGPIWIAFLALVTWIAIYIRHIINLIGAYVDDSHGFDDINDMMLYAPYAEFKPESQARLLELWDELGIPHKERKQISGSPLTIIGLEVNPNTMTITLPDEAKQDLIDELAHWSSPVPDGGSEKFEYRKWQGMAGWMNWAFNVYPLLRPCLNRFYPKLQIRNKDKVTPFTGVHINMAVCYDLGWALRHLHTLPGTRLMSSGAWHPSQADYTLYCDACLSGMGFWYADSTDGFYCDVPPDPPSHLIYYFEALCVVSALTHVAERATHGSRVIIRSDNANTVAIMSSLRCEPELNHLLLHLADILIATKIDLRVLWIPGDENAIADAISRLNIGAVTSLVPGFRLFEFLPPRFPLGALEN